MILRKDPKIRAPLKTIMTETEATFPLMNHLVELKKRLTICAIAISASFVLCLFFAKDLYAFLSLPLKQVLPAGSFFIATHPIEAWLTYLKTAGLSSLFVSAPVLFYELWQFLSPGLYASEKKYTLAFVFFSSLLFVGGALFGYFVIFPFTFDYFLSVIVDTDIHFLPRMEDYLSFSFKMLLAFGLIFELPLFIVFLVLSGIVSVRQLISFQKYLIVCALVVGAILTPPDVISQILLSLPIIALYQVGLFFAWVVTKKRFS